ncbi:unnamed protein product [Gadus morhua 'NCC']
MFRVMEKSQYEIDVLLVATLIILFPIVIKTKSFKKTTRKRGKHPLDPRAHNGTSGHAERQRSCSRERGGPSGSARRGPE